MECFWDSGQPNSEGADPVTYQTLLNYRGRPLTHDRERRQCSNCTDLVKRFIIEWGDTPWNCSCFYPSKLCPATPTRWMSHHYLLEMVAGQGINVTVPELNISEVPLFFLPGSSNKPGSIPLCGMTWWAMLLLLIVMQRSGPLMMVGLFFGLILSCDSSFRLLSHRIWRAPVEWRGLNSQQCIRRVA